MDRISRMPLMPVRTLVVDDAPLMRKAIRQILEASEDIEVVGTAVNGRDCLEKIREQQPDVITLDIDMPVMNGITAIKNIMVRHQIPIVIISSLVQDGYFAFEALRLGVMDFLPKPSKVHAEDWSREEELVRRRVLMASGMQIQRMRRVRRRKKTPATAASFEISPRAAVVMGTTLAGPNTIMHIVTQLSADFPGAIVALQEIHPAILTPFCSSFNEISPIEVIPVSGPTPLRAGNVYMASTFRRLRLEKCPANNGETILEVGGQADHPIDELFDSAARRFKENVCGILLTGVGTDGAAGMKEIKKRGGVTIGQDQACSVYPNLVENAVEQDVVDTVMSPHGIAARIESWIYDNLRLGFRF